MKINEYNQMMKYLTRPAEPEYEQVAMVGKIKKGADLIKKLVKKGEAPKTDVDKVKSKVEADKKNIQELADEGQIPVKDETIVPEDVITVPDPFKEKYQQEFLAHDALYGRRSGDNKVDAEAIAETVADMQGKVYDDMGYSERMDLYDKAYGYLSLLDRVKGAMKESTSRTLQAEGGRIEMAEGGSVKAAELSELLKEAGIEVSPKNIGRFTKTYGINKDPSRPVESGFYKEPTKKQLEKIKKEYDKKILKATGSTEAGKEAFKKREKRAKELLREGKTQVEANKILQKEFDMKGMSSTLTKVSKELRDEGVKIKSGREAEVKTPQSELAKKRSKLVKKTSDPYIEKKIRESKKAAGYGQIDLAHRASMKQNKRLGTKILSDSLGLDPQEVNRKIIKPVENQLDKIYQEQSKLVKKIKREGPSPALRKQLESVNKEISDVVAKTGGRLQGILVDEFSLEPKVVGIDHSKSFGAGVVPTKPVSKMTPYDIELGTMQMKGQLPAVNKLYSGISPELGKLSYEVLKDVAKGIPTPLGAVGLNVGLGVDPTSAIDRVGIGAELAFAPELVKQSARFGPTAQRILNLGLKAAPALRVARALSPIGIASLGVEGAYQFYKALEKEKARIAAMSPEERQQFEEEQTAAAYMGEAGGYADGGRVKFAAGGIAKGMLKMMRKLQEAFRPLRNNIYMNMSDQKSMEPDKFISKVESGYINPRPSETGSYEKLPGTGRKVDQIKELEEIKKVVPKEYKSSIDDAIELTKRNNFIEAYETTRAVYDDINPTLKFENLPDQLFPMSDPLDDNWVLMSGKADIQIPKQKQRMSVKLNPVTGEPTGEYVMESYKTWDDDLGRFLTEEEQKLMGVSTQKGKEGLN